MKTQWTTVKIPEVLFFQEGPGVRKHQFTTEGVKLLNVGNINDSQIDLSKTKIYISEKEASSKYKHFLADDGDLVIASSGIVVDNFHNKIAFIEKKHLPLCMNTSTIRFKVIDKSKLDINYFKYFLKTRFFSSQLQRLITGSAQLNFGPSHLKQIDLLLPPMEDQKRIVDILDKADTLRQKRRQAIEFLDDYLKSVFLEMFGNEENTIELKRIITQKGLIKCGPFGSQLKIDEYVESGIPVYGIDNVMENIFIDAKPKFITNEKYLELKAFDVRAGDVLITRTGTVGRSCIAPENIDKAVIGPNLLKVRCQNGLLLPEFLAYSFNFDENIKRQVKQMSPGATVAVYNTTNLKQLRINLPASEKQRKFVDILKSEVKLKHKMLAQSEELENQFQALMQKAFKGEL